MEYKGNFQDFSMFSGIFFFHAPIHTTIASLDLQEREKGEKRGLPIIAREVAYYIAS